MFLHFFSNAFSSSILSASANLSHHSLACLLPAFWSDLVMRWWCEHRGGFFSPLLFSALFGRPLAATIDLQVELMTKMTNPWGAQVREIMREMERDREGEQETKTSSHNTGMQSHTNTHCTVFPRSSQWLGSLVEAFAARRDATFMQHKTVISFGFRSS